MFALTSHDTKHTNSYLNMLKVYYNDYNDFFQKIFVILGFDLDLISKRKP